MDASPSASDKIGLWHCLSQGQGGLRSWKKGLCQLLVFVLIKIKFNSVPLILVNLGGIFSRYIKNRIVNISQYFLPAAAQTDLGWTPGFTTYQLGDWGKLFYFSLPQVLLFYAMRTNHLIGLSRGLHEIIVSI